MTKLNIIQIAISILLIISILLQQRGSGLSPVFGGTSGGSYRTRRGLEKIIFWATIIFAILFLGLAFLNIILH